MNKGIVALTLALGAAACADRPAQDASTARTTSAPTETTTVTTETRTATAPELGSSGTSMGSSTNAPPRREPVVGGEGPRAMPATPPDSSATGMPAGAAPAPIVTTNPGSADQTKNADNTKINDRDRHGALTPMDQGGSDQERKITQAIRKLVVSDGALSFTAKNVKIITVGSKVTLRGPVKSDQERSLIEARAKQTMGVTEVDNQIEVKK